MSRLRHVTRQRLIYLVGLSLGIINQNEINRKWMFCWMLTPKTSRGGGAQGVSCNFISRLVDAGDRKKFSLYSIFITNQVFFCFVSNNYSIIIIILSQAKILPSKPSSAFFFGLVYVSSFLTIACSLDLKCLWSLLDIRSSRIPDLRFGLLSDLIH